MRRSLLLPLIVSVALFIENMDATVISTSLPMIAGDLHVNPLALKLALTSYLVSLAVFIPISGWVADRFGARTTFASAIGVFMLGSVLCALSGSLPAFVAARFLQGVGGAMMVPVGRLVILRSIPRNELVEALNYLTMPALLGPVLGPPLGGFITTYFHWSWIFLINLPVGVAGMWLTFKYIPNLREAKTPPLDVRGFLLSGVGLSLLMLGLATLWEHMLKVQGSIACVVAGTALVALYVVHARRTEHPLLELRLYRLPTFRAGVLGGAVFRLGQGAMPLLLPMMLQLGFGLSPFQSGMLTFASAVGSLFMKTIATRILRTFGFRRVLTLNAVLGAATLGVCALFTAGTPHLLIIAALLVGGCVRSLQFTSINAISYAEVSHSDMSRATSMASVVQQLALSGGVTLGAYALQLTGWFRGVSATDATSFQIAFGIVGIVAAVSVTIFATLHPDAGADMSGRTQTPREVRGAA